MALTREQLLALPERDDYVDSIITSPGDPRGRPGTTVRERIPPKFVAHAPAPDDVLLFTDDKGERWTVDYHLEGGPYKRRAFF